VHLLAGGAGVHLLASKVGPIFRIFMGLGPYSQHFNLFVRYTWQNKLECHITLGWKGLGPML
jgi:hypothetical protein